MANEDRWGSIPLHGIGMLYEKSQIGERLSDDELETLWLHFKQLHGLLNISGPRFAMASNMAFQEFYKLDGYRNNRMSDSQFSKQPPYKPPILP